MRGSQPHSWIISIGALLAHIGAVEQSYQIMTFEDRLLSPEENARLATALALSEKGRHTLRGLSLESYVDQLAAIRQRTLELLANRDDAWLDAAVHIAP